MNKLIVFLLLLSLCLSSACTGPEEHASTDIPSVSPTSAAPAETETPKTEASLPEPVEYTVQELCFTRDGLRIYGELYLPDGDGPFSTVIIGHGLDSNLTDTEGYAKIFARYGIAAYVFDFIGGGTEIRSDGDIPSCYSNQLRKPDGFRSWL